MLCRGGLVCEVDTFLGANYGGAAWAAKSDGCAREKIGHPRFQEQRSLCGSQVRQSGDSNFLKFFFFFFLYMCRMKI
jgi:hypothetical protein